MTTINVTLIYSLNINGRIVSTNEKESNEKTVSKTKSTFLSRQSFLISVAFRAAFRIASPEFQSPKSF